MEQDGIGLFRLELLGDPQPFDVNFSYRVYTGVIIKSLNGDMLHTAPTATHGVDYSFVPDVISNPNFFQTWLDRQSFTIPAGETEAFIEFQLHDDPENEDDELFRIDFGQPSGGGAFVEKSGFFTIEDDDSRIEISSTPMTVREGDGLQEITFTAKHTHPDLLGQELGHPIEFETYFLYDTASTDDITLSSFGPLTIPAGEDTVVLPFEPLADEVNETDEYFAIQVRNPTRGVAGTTGTITIEDWNSTIEVSVNAPLPVQESSGSVAVPVSASEPLRAPLTVWYTITSDSADLETDYLGPLGGTGAVTIAAGESVGEIVIPLVDDSLHEGDEVFHVEITDMSYGNVEDVAGSILPVTILDDDADLTGVEIIVEDLQYIEGDGDVTGIVRFSEPVDSAITLSLSDLGGTADSSDYRLVDTEVTIPEGQTTTTFAMAILDDALMEDIESFRIKASVGDLTGEGEYLLFDDGVDTISVSIGDSSARESMGAVVLPVTLSQAPVWDMTVQYRIIEGTALSGSDYVEPVTSAFVISAGEVGPELTIPLVDDQVVESNEDFVVEITSLSYGIIGDGQALATITDDDVDLTEIEVTVTANQSFHEGDSTDNLVDRDVTGKIQISTAVEHDVTFMLTDLGGSASASDYELVDTQVTIPAGFTSALFALTILDDTLEEHTESFTIQAEYGGEAYSGVFQIIDDNDIVAFYVEPVQISESAGTIDFAVSATQELLQQTTVTYQVIPGSAKPDADYIVTQPVGTISIDAGETGGTFSINVTDDSVHEETESFSVRIQGWSSGTVDVDRRDATITIDDDDADLTGIDIIIDDLEFNEGDGNVTGIVRFSEAVDTPITLALADLGGTAEDSEYDLLTTEVTIPKDQTHATFDLFIGNDSLVELDKSFTIEAAVGDRKSTGEVTILEDNDVVSFSVPSDIEVVESDGSVIVEFTASQPVPSFAPTVLVDFAMFAIDATPGTDYLSPTLNNGIPGAFTISPGQTKATLTIPLVDDSIHEDLEFFGVRINSVSWGVIQSDTTIVSIEDDDADLTDVDILINPLSFTEGVGEVSGRVELSTAVLSPITLTLSNLGGTATAADYQLTDTEVTIPAGQTAAFFDMLMLDDDILENPEEFTIEAAVGERKAYGQFVINDDGNDTVGISLSESVSVLESENQVLVPISLSQELLTPLTLSYNVAPGSAEPGSDYEEPAEVWNSITIPAGSQQFDVAVTLLDDFDLESDETFSFAIDGPSYGEISQASVVVTIEDDDTDLENIDIILDDRNVSEAVGMFTGVVRLTAPLEREVTLTMNQAARSARSPADYQLLSSEVTIPANQLEGYYTVSIVEDEIYDPEEYFIVGASLGATTKSARITIVEDDALTASIAGHITVTESDGAIDVPVTLSQIVPQGVSLGYQAIPGTATNDDFFGTIVGSVSVNAGENSGAVRLYLTDDWIHETSEHFTIQLTSFPAGAIAQNQGTTTVTILDDDADLSGVDIQIEAGTFTEGDGNVDGILTFSEPVAHDVTFALNVIRKHLSLEEEEYQLLDSEVTVQADSTEGTFSINIPDDAVLETTEWFRVEATTRDLAIQGVFYIGDDEVVSVAGAEAPESDGTVDVTISVDEPLQNALSVLYNVIPGTATSESDFILPTEDHFTIPEGETSGTISIPLVNDSAFESTEQFQVQITHVYLGGHTVETDGSPANVTVIDDDPDLSDIDITVDSLPFTEGAGTVQGFVRLSEPANRPVNFTLNALTADGDTASPSEYALLDSEVTIAAGDTFAAFDLTIPDDDVVELTESFTVEASIDVYSAAGRMFIEDNEVIGVSVGQTAIAVEEAVGTVTIPITTSQPVLEPLTVHYELTAASAQPGEDYDAPLVGTITIPANQNAGSLTIDILDDEVHEPDETFTFEITSLSYGVIQGTETVVTIENDDADLTGLTITVHEPTVSEASGAGVGAIEISRPLQHPITLTVSDLGGTASTSDYELQTSEVTIPAGQTSGSYQFQILDDTRIEETEEFSVLVSIQDVWATGTVSILDDEPDITIEAPDTVEEDAGNVTAAVVVRNPSPVAQQVSIFVVGGTATENEDFELTEHVITIPANALRQEFQITIIDDEIEEGVEHFTLSTSPGTATTVAPLFASRASTEPTLIVGPQLLLSATGSGNGDGSLVCVMDNDAPVFSLGGPGTFSEGTNVTHGPGISISRIPIHMTESFDVTLSVAPLSPPAIEGTDKDYIIDKTYTIDPTTHLSDHCVIASTRCGTLYTHLSIVDDNIPEPTEHFQITLSVSGLSNYQITTGTRAYTIEDDDYDAPPTVSISGGSNVSEGDSTFATVSLSHAPSSPVTVELLTAGHGRPPHAAIPDSDYDAASVLSTLLTFNPGDPISQTINVSTIEDTFEESNEQFFVALGTVTGGTRSSTANSTTYTIIDDDDGGPIKVSLSAPTTIEEGEAEQAFVSLNRATSTDVVVSLGTSVSEFSQSLRAESGDYSTPGFVTIPAGDTGKQFWVTTSHDSDDDHERFRLSITSASGAEIDYNAYTSVIAISDDEYVSNPPPPTTPRVNIGTGDGDASEPDDAEPGDDGLIVFYRGTDIDFDEPLTASFTITQGSEYADPQADYSVTSYSDDDLPASAAQGSVSISGFSGTVHFPANVSQVVAKITPVADEVIEGDELVKWTLATSPSYRTHTRTATVTIQDAVYEPPTISGSGTYHIHNCVPDPTWKTYRLDVADADTPISDVTVSIDTSVAVPDLVLPTDSQTVQLGIDDEGHYIKVNIAKVPGNVSGTYHLPLKAEDGSNLTQHMFTLDITSDMGLEAPDVDVPERVYLTESGSTTAAVDMTWTSVVGADDYEWKLFSFTPNGDGTLDDRDWTEIDSGTESDPRTVEDELGIGYYAFEVTAGNCAGRSETGVDFFAVLTLTVSLWGNNPETQCGCSAHQPGDEASEDTSTSATGSAQNNVVPEPDGIPGFAPAMNSGTASDPTALARIEAPGSTYASFSLSEEDEAAAAVAAGTFTATATSEGTSTPLTASRTFSTVSIGTNDSSNEQVELRTPFQFAMPTASVVPFGRFSKNMNVGLEFEVPATPGMVADAGGILPMIRLSGSVSRDMRVPALNTRKSSVGRGMTIPGMSYLKVPDADSPAGEGPVFYRGNGTIVEFRPTPAGDGWESPEGTFTKIAQGSNGLWQVTTDTGEVRSFNGDGTLNSISQPGGHAIQVNYTDDQNGDGVDNEIDTVIDTATGATMKYAYVGGKVDTITFSGDPASTDDDRVWKYEFAGDNLQSITKQVPVDMPETAELSTFMTYNADDQIETIERRDAHGNSYNTTTVAYDQWGNVDTLTITDEVNDQSKVWDYTFAESNRLDKAVAGDSEWVIPEHDWDIPVIREGEKDTVKGPRNTTITRERDDHGHVVLEKIYGVTGISGSSNAIVATETPRNRDGQIVETSTYVDGVDSGETTKASYGYDAFNRLTSIEYADGTSEVWTYDLDADGPDKPETFTDRAGRKTDYQYAYGDGRQTMATTTHSGSIVSKVEWVYDGRNVIIEKQHTGASGETSGNNRPATRYYYDGMGRLIHTRYTTWQGLTSNGAYSEKDTDVWMSQGYDAHGNVAWTTNPYHVETIGYGEAAVPNINPDDPDTKKTLTEFQYDGNGNVLKMTLPSANGTAPRAVYEYEYNDAGMLKYSWEPGESGQRDDSSRTEYQYDGFGRLHTVTGPDPDGPGFGQHNPLKAETTTYIFDAMDNVIEERVVANGSLQTKSFYQYNKLGFLEWQSEVYTSDTVSRNDVQGSLNFDVRDNYKYDVQGRVRSYHAAGGHSGVDVVSVYDDVQRTVNVTDAEGASTVTTYDALGRVTKEERISRQLTTVVNGQDVPLGNAPVVITTEYEYRDGDTSFKFADGSDIRGTLVITNVTGSGETVAHFHGGGETLPESRTLIGENGQVLVSTSGDPDGSGLARPLFTTNAYNPLGQLVATTLHSSWNHQNAWNDPDARVTNYDYNAAGQVVQMISPDPDGDGSDNPLPRLETTYAYDNLGQLTNEYSQRPLGQAPSLYAETTYTYYADGALKRQAVLDRDSDASNDWYTEYHYDNFGRQTRITTPNPDNTVAVHTDYTYNQLGLLKTESAGDPGGGVGRAVTEYDYKPLVPTDPDSPGIYLYEVTVPGGTGDTANVGAAGTATTRYTYDSSGRLEKEFRPDPDTGLPGDVEFNRWTYDIMGRPTQEFTISTQFAEDNPQWDRVIYGYGNFGLLNSVWSDVGTAQRNFYDGLGRVTATVDPLGRRTEFELDGFGRTTEVRHMIKQSDGSFAVNDISETFYDSFGQVAESTQLANVASKKQVTKYDYDGLGRMTAREVVLSAGESLTEEWKYKQTGQLDRHINGWEQPTIYSYDAAGRLTQTNFADNRQARTFTYTTAGQVETETEIVSSDLSNTTTYQYTDIGQLKSVTLPQLDSGSIPVTQYDYDVAGNQIRLTDPAQNVTEWVYDYRNRLTEEKTQINGHDRYRGYRYYENDLQRYYIDRHGVWTENTYTFRFGAPNNHKLVREDVHVKTDGVWSIPQTTTYAYGSGSGLLLDTITTYNGGSISSQIEFEYDKLGRVEGQRDYISGSITESDWTAFDVTYDLDELGRRKATQFEFTTQVGGADAVSVEDSGTQYFWDRANRLTFAKQFTALDGGGYHLPVQRNVELAYLPNGSIDSIKRWQGNHNVEPEMETDYRYAGWVPGQVEKVWHQDLVGGTRKYEWTHDGAGRTETAKTPLDTYTYSYDTNDQVIGFDGAATSDNDQNQTYDGNGNNNAYGEGEYNRITTDGEYTYQYDLEGNRISRTRIVGGNYEIYDWNYRNQLISVTSYTSSHVKTGEVRYDYDGLNRRIRRQVDSDGNGTYEVSERMLYDTNIVNPSFAEVVLIVDELTGQPVEDSVIHRFFNGPVPDMVFSDETADGTVNWLLQNRQNTVTDVVQFDAGSDLWSVVNHLEYNSFGELTSQTDATYQPLQTYTGQILDDVTGLHYYDARWFDSNVNQFVSEDPIGFAAGDTNVRRYVGNGNPNGIDPTGLIDPTGTLGINGSSADIGSRFNWHQAYNRNSPTYQQLLRDRERRETNRAMQQRGIGPLDPRNPYYQQNYQEWLDYQRSNDTEPGFYSTTTEEAREYDRQTRAREVIEEIEESIRAYGNQGGHAVIALWRGESGYFLWGPGGAFEHTLIAFGAGGVCRPINFREHFVPREGPTGPPRGFSAYNNPPRVRPSSTRKPKPTRNHPIDISTAGRTPPEAAAIREYAQRANEWLDANGGATIVGTKGKLRRDASAAARAEKQRAARAGTPYCGQPGHVPDTGVTGNPIPPAGWLDMPGTTNQSAGGVLGSRIGQYFDHFTVDGRIP